jgi:peptide-methionine (S)-S-oxide reductase
MIEEATLGAGCFWCIEACLIELNGVSEVYPAYAGGEIVNPTYEQICTGNTGHAEVARVIFDTDKISFEELLEVFWFIHNPTQLNRQGNDVGSQYRSAIFYHSEEQKNISESYLKRLSEEKVWAEDIVTEITPVSTFYRAENYHQNYFALNPQNMYCQAVVRPKVEKFRKVFAEKRKK